MAKRHDSIYWLLVIALAGCSPTGLGGEGKTSTLPPPPKVEQAVMETLVTGNNHFAFDLYKELKSKPGNLFCSPYSVTSALAMTYAGARGQTQTEMARVLHFDLPEPDLHAAAGRLIWELEPDDGDAYQLAIANRIWPRTNIELLPEFTQLLAQNYRSDVVPLDYSVPGANDIINRWVEEHTRGKIKKIVPPLSARTTMVLSNAIYFKGDWTHPFEVEDTRDADFLINKDQKTRVPMMSQMEGNFRFHEFDTFKMLDMPYQGNQLSMIVMLPKTHDLPALEEQLSAENFNKWYHRMRHVDVDVSFPKFKFTKTYELNDNLKRLGMSSAFDAADFSGMSSSEMGCISKVLHKAFIEVNEKGTEAAAATIVTLEESARLTPSFRANRPFLFAIRDNNSGSLLFLGRIVDPSQE